MGSFFARVKIIVRIYLLIAIAAIGIIGVVVVGANEIKVSLTDSRKEQTRRLVEVAYSLVANLVERANKGEFSEDDARQRAAVAISSLRYDTHQYYWINDWDGKMIAHGTKPELVGNMLLDKTDTKGAKIYVDFINIAKNKGADTYQYYWPDVDGVNKPKISYVKGVPAWQWVIGSGVFVDDVEKAVWEVEKKLGLAAGLLLLIAVVIANFIGRSISKPVQSLNEAMQQLAGGDTTGHIGMDERRDEIGDMAKTVKVFQENARQVEKLKAEQAEMERRAAIEKKQAMEKMANDFEQSVGQIVNIVASAATQLQSNAKHLSEMADQTNRQSAAVAAATEEASSSVSTVASATEELSASIGEINRQVSESSRVAQDAVSEVKKTDETVSTLSDAAAQIGDVVKLIQDIAEQTNLLALNATIEAARAGEAGKGFAVVASEVKNLATQTARATEEISKKIVTVQSVSTDSVNAIRSIGKTIEHISEITGAIAGAIHEQTAATKEISNNVQQASAGTNEVSSNIVNVTHAAAESRGASDEVLQASGELSKQSERLRSEIQAFLSKVRQG